MNARPIAQGHRELMTQHQDLGVPPPRLPLRQAQHRHGPGHDEEISFRPASRRSSHLRRDQDLPAPRSNAGRADAICRTPAQLTQVFGTHKWASEQITSLREVTTEDVTTAIARRPRLSGHTAHTGLRSLFRALKRERLIFRDPARTVSMPVSRAVPRAPARQPAERAARPQRQLGLAGSRWETSLGGQSSRVASSRRAKYLAARSESSSRRFSVSLVSTSSSACSSSPNTV